MARFFGIIGFVDTVDNGNGVYKEQVIKEENYRGDILKNSRRWDNGESLNDNLNLNNSVSIVADDYAFNHCPNIRYVVISGCRWKVTNVEVQRPRLILTIGGVYNGPAGGPQQ